MTNLEYNITNPYTEKEIEEFEEWKVKSEYVIGQKKMGEEYKSITQWLKTMPNKDLENVQILSISFDLNPCSFFK